MIERPIPYVGVSGVVSPEQQQTIEAFADSINLRQSRQLILGVKAVHKTQFLDIKNKYGQEWYPIGEEQFGAALAPKTQTTPSLAVAQTYFDPAYIDNPGYRDYFTDRIFRRGEQWIDGIQFDMLPWYAQPEMLDFLVKLKSKHDTKLFLQVHKPAMESLGPHGVVEALGPYAEILDYVLFDSSHGTGKKLDAPKLMSFLEQAYSHEALNSVGFAIAGGLNGTIIRDELPQVVSEFPDVSWDAEGQLHPAKADKTMPLDMAIVSDYLEASRTVAGTIG